MNNIKTLHHPIKYIHLRWIDGQLNAPETHHLSPFGGMTIAYQQVGDGKYHIAYARCNGRDHFCKRIGRNISSGRLLSGDCYEIEISATDDRYTKFVQFVSEKVRQAFLSHYHE